MKYEGDIGTIQRRLAETSDLYRRRLSVLDAISVQPGETVLEVGCGGGAMLPPLAAAAGADGNVIGLDISADQVAAANILCEKIESAEAVVHDVQNLPYQDYTFDAIVGIQVIEYLDRPSDALSELRRVCKADGRLVLFATNWDTMFWNCDAPELTAKVLEAWRQHAPVPNLPAELRSYLNNACFKIVYQKPVSIINSAYHEDAFAYWAAQLILAFATAKGLLKDKEATQWLESLQRAQQADHFFFSSTPVLTLAIPS